MLSGSDKGNGGGLVLECESEALSDVQLTRIQKLKDEVSKLQDLIRTKSASKSSEITVPLLVNGTSTSSSNTPITNGPSVVGLQVPQFLLLQNGQMIAASSTIQSANIASNNTVNSIPIVTTQAGTIAFKNTTSRTSSSTRSQKRVVNTAKSTSITPAAIGNSDSSEIQVLNELRPQPQVVNARSLREVRIQGSDSLATTTTATTAITTNTNINSTTTFKTITSTVDDSNEVNDVSVLGSSKSSSTGTARMSPTSTVSTIGRSVTPVTATTSIATNSTTSSSSSSSTSYNKYPLLNIIARPRNNLPPSIAMKHRKELDTKVKLVLVKSPQEFVEWLLAEGLIRNSQSCAIHKTTTLLQPFKLKLGMFSDPKALATSGGYVWISQCCGKKYVSVYSGSIFGSTPIEKVPPTFVLKLIYHWSCQTSIINVENWVKVDKAFINKMFQYLRCVCSVILHDKVYDFGFDGTAVELGIVSLGTSTADGTKKAVKVEILGLYDRKMRSYRLFASEPEPGSSSRQRFVRILKPLEQVVHTNAFILCDQSVDRNCLYSMKFKRVSVCETSENEDSLQYNGRIMNYLRKHVPKMFQSALSQLNLQQVQLVLDELCWRERYSSCAAYAYNNMMEHITYLTARETDNPGVLHLLDFVAQSPQHNWRYKTQQFSKGPATLQPSIILNMNSDSAHTPQISHDSVSVSQSPLDHNNKMLLTTRPMQGASPASTTNNESTPGSTRAESTELEPFYYGHIEGDSKLGREINTAKFVCHICSLVSENNIEFYTHLKLHVTRTAPYGDTKICCDYCTDHFTTEEMKIFHQRVKHMHLDGRHMWCRICSDNFSNEFALVNHMAKKHYESEMPYRCTVCNFVTSIFHSLIDHFNSAHKDTCYVMCHFCLVVKSISPSTSAAFSHRMYQHLQRHMHQQTRCKHCQLSFYSSFLRDDHKKRDHISLAGFPGLQRYKLPAEQKVHIMFRPWIKKHPPPGPSAVTKLTANPPVAMSSTIEWHDLKMDIFDLKFYCCVECGSKLSLADHFKLYMKCTQCSYSTCCRNMISRHSETFHPQGRTKKAKYKMAPPIILPKALFCICGFSSRSGNHLARHLGTCEGGRKSAYASVSDAMVYHGDVTGGVLNLTSLNLENVNLASILPDVPINNTALDITQFMKVAMEVDES